MLKRIWSFISRVFHLDKETNYIAGSENLKAPLPKEEEDILVLDYNNTGNLKSRNDLIEHNLRLVVYVAKKYETNLFKKKSKKSIRNLTR